MKRLFVIMMMLVTPIFGSEDRFVEVVGESYLSVVPDEIHLTVDLSRQEWSIKDAKKKLGKTVNKVLDYAKQTQPDSRHIKTEFFSVKPKYGKQSTKREFLGYWAKTQIRIVFTDDEAYYQFMNKLPDLAPDHSSSVSFRLGDTSAHHMKLKRMAIEDAKQQAETLAASAGAKIGDVLQIRDVHIGREHHGAMRTLEAKGGSVQIEPGEQQVQARATVRFELN